MTRQKRYGRRIQLQSAIARTLVVLLRHLGESIESDETTGRLAVELMAGLRTFARAAGVPIDSPTAPATGGTDLSRIREVIAIRRTATASRYRRAAKQQRRKGRSRPSV